MVVLILQGFKYSCTSSPFSVPHNRSLLQNPDRLHELTISIAGTPRPWSRTLAHRRSVQLINIPSSLPGWVLLHSGLVQQVQYCKPFTHCTHFFPPSCVTSSPYLTASSAGDQRLSLFTSLKRIRVSVFPYYYNWRWLAGVFTTPPRKVMFKCPHCQWHQAS